jgi:hypothetical protein
MTDSDIERDEQFVVKALDEYDKIADFEKAINNHFKQFYPEEKIIITLDQDIRDWIIKVKKQTTRVSYAEGIPKAVHDFL